jgi:hypothetical protein
MSQEQPSPDPPGFLPQTGNYQELLSYRKSEIIYDLTFRFSEKHLKRGDRTIDQMVQAARSGKQNIAEGCKASITSAEMELKLINVARASLEELLLDDQDYLRVPRPPPLGQRQPEALYVRKLGRPPMSRTRRTAPSWTPAHPKSLRQKRRHPRASDQSSPQQPENAAVAKISTLPQETF